MILTDVNVLIYAVNRRASNHRRYKEWLDEVVGGDEPFGLSEFVLSSVVRIITNPRIFGNPKTLDSALRFGQRLRDRPNCVIVQPGPRHWDIFVDFCRHVKARGDIVPDAYLAALAVESGSEWITTDRDFGKFPGLRWRHPLDDSP